MCALVTGVQACALPISADADAAFDAAQILEIERVAVALPVWRQKIGYGRYWRTLGPEAVAGAVGDEARADLAEPFRYATAEDAGIRSRHLLAGEAVREDRKSTRLNSRH